MLEKYLNPEIELWSKLSQRCNIQGHNLENTVSEIFGDIEKNGDKAVRFYTQKFDKVTLDNLTLDILSTPSSISQSLQSAIDIAYRNIYTFHAQQTEVPQKVETMKGVTCWRENRAIEKVGIYVPNGSAPLFSTVLMLAIPAQLAGCKEIVLCTPPNKDGSIHPAIVYAAKKSGVTKLCKVGGIQAIAALTFGTESVPQVYKIFGPGNQYVTAAKQYAQKFGIAIDMPAGPSEVLVIGDSTANPAYIAADLLAQAEHGKDSQAMVVSNSEKVIDDVMVEVSRQLELLPRKELAALSLKNSKALVFETLERCFDFSNFYAPEHLILSMDNAESFVSKVESAGSVFLGHLSCESIGDYASGTNHTLPTNGYARNYSGVSLDSFVKKITFQIVSQEGFDNIATTVETMAVEEQLFAHKNAVTVRKKYE